MIVCKINIYVLVRIAGKDLADFLKGFAGYDYLVVIIDILQLYASDGNAVSV